jgi:hypothetical protein
LRAAAVVFSAPIDRSTVRAIIAISRLSAAAIQIVWRVPSSSSSRKVATTQPATAPRVLSA